jgi:hypothetical protein
MIYNKEKGMWGLAAIALVLIPAAVGMLVVASFVEPEVRPDAVPAKKQPPAEPAVQRTHPDISERPPLERQPAVERVVPDVSERPQPEPVPEESGGVPFDPDLKRPQVERDPKSDARFDAKNLDRTLLWVGVQEAKLKAEKDNGVRLRAAVTRCDDLLRQCRGVKVAWTFAVAVIGEKHVQLVPRGAVSPPLLKIERDLSRSRAAQLNRGETVIVYAEIEDARVVEPTLAVRIVLSDLKIK